MTSFRTWIESTWDFNETIQGRRAFVYHRSKSPDALKGGFKAKGVRSLFGDGVYATYDLEGQMQENMIDLFGEYIWKSYANLTDFIIFDKDIAQKLYGKGYRIIDQVKRILSGESMRPDSGAVAKLRSGSENIDPGQIMMKSKEFIWNGMADMKPGLRNDFNPQNMQAAFQKHFPGGKQQFMSISLPQIPQAYRAFVKDAAGHDVDPNELIRQSKTNDAEQQARSRNHSQDLFYDRVRKNIANVFMSGSPVNFGGGSHTLLSPEEFGDIENKGMESFEERLNKFSDAVEQHEGEETYSFASHFYKNLHASDSLYTRQDVMEPFLPKTLAHKVKGMVYTHTPIQGGKTVVAYNSDSIIPISVAHVPAPLNKSQFKAIKWEKKSTKEQQRGMFGRTLKPSLIMDPNEFTKKSYQMKLSDNKEFQHDNATYTDLYYNWRRGGKEDPENSGREDKMIEILKKWRMIGKGKPKTHPRKLPEFKPVRDIEAWTKRYRQGEQRVFNKDGSVGHVWMVTDEDGGSPFGRNADKLKPPYYAQVSWDGNFRHEKDTQRISDLSHLPPEYDWQRGDKYVDSRDVPGIIAGNSNLGMFGGPDLDKVVGISNDIKPAA